VYVRVCIAGDDSDDDGKGKGKGKEVELEVDGLQDADNSEADIAKLLGFSGFSSTKVRVKMISVHSVEQKSLHFQRYSDVFSLKYTGIMLKIRLFGLPNALFNILNCYK
jgi:hypothetical protein